MVPVRRAAAIIAETAGLALALALVPVRPAAAEPWTLDRVLAAAREHDPALRSARASGEANRAMAAQTWALLAPHVTLSGGFTRSDDPAMLFSQKLWQGGFTPEDFAIERLNHPDARGAIQAGITVDQPLWNGGREWVAPGLAAHRNRAATALERAAVADRLLAVVETWAQAIEARGHALAAEQGLAAAEAMRASAAERFRTGQVPELDTLRAVAREAEARVRALGAGRQAAVMTDRLARLVRAPLASEELVAEGTLPAAPEAAAGRGELRALRESAAAARTESRTATLRLLPSVNARLAATHYRPAESGEFERRWMVAVSADLPLFDGAQRWNEARAARARAVEAQARLEATERDLATALAAAGAEDAVAAARRDAARAGRAAAEEALRLATLRYRAGLLPLTELLAADAEATAARAAEVEASSAVFLARYRLLHAMGELR
jgi:outer membrane protein